MLVSGVMTNDVTSKTAKKPVITLLQHVAEMPTAQNYYHHFWPIALTVALMLQCCVCLSSDVCIVPKRCVLEQQLLLTAYRKSFIRNLLAGLPK